MTTKAIGRILVAPGTLALASCSPNADAVAPATIPRGAIHPTKARSCPFAPAEVAVRIF